MDRKKDKKLQESENLIDLVPYSKIVDKKNPQYFQSFLVYIAGKYSLVPELAHIIPPEELFNFLFAFAGQSISVPDQKAMVSAFKDLDIYFSLKENPSSLEIQRLANKYSTTMQTVKTTFDKVKESLDSRA